MTDYLDIMGKIHLAEQGPLPRHLRTPRYKNKLKKIKEAFPDKNKQKEAISILNIVELCGDDCLDAYFETIPGEEEKVKLVMDFPVTETNGKLRFLPSEEGVNNNNN